MAQALSDDFSKPVDSAWTIVGVDVEDIDRRQGFAAVSGGIEMFTQRSYRYWGAATSGVAAVQDVGEDEFSVTVSLDVTFEHTNDHRPGVLICDGTNYNGETLSNHYWVDYRSGSGHRIETAFNGSSNGTESDLGALTDIRVTRTDAGGGDWTYTVEVSTDNRDTWTTTHTDTHAFAGKYAGPGHGCRNYSAYAASKFTAVDYEIEGVASASVPGTRPTPSGDWSGLTILKRWKCADLTEEGGGTNLVDSYNTGYSTVDPRPGLDIIDGPMVGMSAFDFRTGGLRLPYCDTGYEIPDNDPITLSCWIRTSNWDDELAWFGSAAPDGTGLDNRCYIGCQDGDVFMGGGATIERQTYELPAALKAREWVHVALVIGSGTMRAYFDGVDLTGAVAYTGTIASEGTAGTNGVFRRVVIGMAGGQSNHASDACISDCIIFDGALSALEVAQVALGESESASADLTVADSEVALESTTITLGQSHPLTVASSEVGVESSTVTMGQTHPLAVADSEIGLESSGLTLGQSHPLTVADSAIVTESTGVTLGQVHPLTVASSEVATESGAVTMGQSHPLTVADSELTLRSTTVTGSLAGVMAPQLSQIALESTTVSLGQVHSLTVANSAIATESSAVTLGQTHPLAVADSEIGLESSTVTGSAGDMMTLAPSQLLFESTTILLGQIHPLTIADSELALVSTLVSLDDAELADITGTYTPPAVRFTGTYTAP